MRHVVSATLIVVGIFHLLPVAGVQLYGIPFGEPTLALLMRH